MEVSESTASDLTVSLTQSELEEDLAEGGAPDAAHGGGDLGDHGLASPLHSHHATKTFHFSTEAPVGTFQRYKMFD